MDGPMWFVAGAVCAGGLIFCGAVIAAFVLPSQAATSKRRWGVDNDES
jgi:hypothetical protein